MNKPDVVPQSVVEAIINQGFPALAKTTKPIPASVFSYRFASPSNNQTPYYISSDIVLSGGIAQQTRRRIVHNEVERRRKDKINGWITKLAETIPGCLQGKQSKNLVLERAVDYFKEVNNKVAQLEECQQQRNSLVLDNQALKQRLEVLQKQNDKLQELLRKNNINVPENLGCTTSTATQSTQSVTITNEHQPHFSGQLGVSDNTVVTWMTPGKTPMATSSTCISTATEISPSFSQSVKEVLISPSLSIGSSVSTTSPVQQPNYSSYTVSSIMNELPEGVVSLVDSNNTQENVPSSATLTVGVNNTAVNNTASNNSVMSAAVPVAVTNKLNTQTLGSLCVPEGRAIMGSQNCTVQDVEAQGSNGTGTVYLAGSGGIITQGKGTSAPQVVLCQAPKVSGTHGSASINVPKGIFVAPVVTQSSNVLNLSHQAAPVVSNNNIIIRTQGPIVTLGNPAVPSAPATARSISNKPLFSSSLNGISSTEASQKSTLLQPQGVVALNRYVTTVPSTTTNNPVNQGFLPMTINQGVSMATDNVCVLPSNALQPGLVILNTNTAPVVNSIPLTSQALSESASTPSHLITGNLTSGLVTLNVPPKPVGVVTGTPNKILQQPQNLVAVNIPQAALQVNCTTSATTTSYGNALVSLPTSSANFTPSSRTAFVIVRSTQPQQTVHYTIPSQAVSQINYNVGEMRNATTNCVTLMSTRTTPSTVAQPALFQTNTGVLQPPCPFSFNVSSSTGSAISTTTCAQNSQKSFSSSLTNRTSTLVSSQPFTKTPKSVNAKKRPSSRSHSNSKSKKAKQSKSSQQGVSNSTSNLTSTSSTSQVLTSTRNETNEPHRNPNSMDICQHEDMLSIQNFSISSLIPSIDAQTSAKSSSPLNTKLSDNVVRTTGDSTRQVRTSQPASSNQRLSHSIDSLTGRNNVIGQAQNGFQQHQQQSQSNILSFSAESLLGSGDDLVPNIQPITCSNAATHNFNNQNTFSISAFQESANDGTINQTFSNFSAEALISESDLIGISNEPQSSRSNCTQGAQSGKHTHTRTQMFSDFSAESLINSSDLGSGLSYAIDNLISRSDNNDNSIAMVSVNPNLLHTATSSMILPDKMNQSMYSTSIPVTPMLQTSVYPHSTAMPVTPILKNHSLTSNMDYQNTINTTSTDLTSYGTMNMTSFSKYGFSSPQKQQKDIFSYKPNGTVTLTYPTSSVTTSPTFLKHSVDSITASQHNSTSTTGAVAFNSPLTNNVVCPTFNSLFFDQISPQQFPIGGNSHSNNLNKTFQGPTMGSFA
ncbi:basic helix-loop-helix domain-containing protein USF3-like [Actinia tenebrosa]|uniref:Basic helix-loop-helix domain-containing protein USF3-like n=1 Tax=Actinia tenebrosa TaxID=6105 RepID=A0A6P8HU83_ACTTE|nr:basic helix-loop-helix domain-containing protein USF3-like [Actinia tenebrosa]